MDDEVKHCSYPVGDCVLRDAWQPIKTAPFGTQMLLLWYGGLIPHYEVTLGSLVINPEFERRQFWNGYEYRPMDNIIGWSLPTALPETPPTTTKE